MLTVTVELLHGAIRAGSPDDTVMASGDQAAEWPPSPARLFSAFVAADGTRDRTTVTTGHELGLLENAPPPVILADPLEDTTSTHHVSRFVVKDKAEANLVHNYPARSSAEVRPGTRLSPKHSRVTYIWEIEVDQSDLDGLRRRAARIGYLGCADSPVRVQVSDQVSEHSNELTRWRPGAAAGTTLPVPYPGFLEHLDDAYDRWAAGEQSRRSWIPTRRERYSSRPQPIDVPEPTTLWVNFDRAVGGQKVLLVTETLRAAVISHYDDQRRNSLELWRLSGHEIPTTVSPPYQLVRFLALPDVGHRRSDGRIHGAAIWFPADADPALVEGVRDVLHRSLRKLHAPGLQVTLGPGGSNRSKASVRPSRWEGPSHAWSSATPVVAERGRRSGPTADDVRAWFLHAGHPTPELVSLSPVPTVEGATRLGGGQVHRAGRDRHPFFWVDVVFAEPVTGPICVGRSRSFGLGLFAPAGNPRTRSEEVAATSE